jgi:hypothetical protein
MVGASEQNPMMAGDHAMRIGANVRVTFSDHSTVTGTLVADRGDEIDVEHTDGDRNVWTATYSRTGDDDTPAVTAVEQIPDDEAAEGYEAPRLF